MNKEQIISTIIEREKLRKISKLERLIKDPIRTIPYYILATRARIKPFEFKFKTLWGDNMTGYLPNINTFIYYGYPESNLTIYILKNIKKDDVFIDGGANIGFYSLLVSNIIEEGTIHSFEPTPSTFETLKKNLMNKKNVFLNNLALSNTEDQIDFIDYGPGYSSFNSIQKRIGVSELKNKDNRIKIQATTLDKYCLDKKIKPTFIKLDLEGSESYALQGSIEIIRKYKPKISIEVAGQFEWIGNIKKSNEILTNEGYISFFIDENGELKKHDLENNYTYDNLIYIHKDEFLKNHANN